MDLGSVFNKSLFSKDAYAAAIGKENENGYAVIKITPGIRSGTSDKTRDPSIKGVLKNNLNFSVDATWEQAGGSGVSLIDNARQAITGSVNGFFNRAGFANLDAIYTSKKLYKSSGFLNLSPEIRVMDWNGTGQPLIAALLLSLYALPSKSLLQNEDIQKLTDRLEAWVKSVTPDIIEKGIDKLSNTITEGLSDFKSSLQNKAPELTGLIDSTISNLKRNTVDDLDESITLRASPTPVTIEIGQYFKNTDMVIDNVSYEFSKECTKKGPLYVDISLKLSSRTYIRDIEALGLLRPVSNRFYTVDQSEITDLTVE